MRKWGIGVMRRWGTGVDVEVGKCINGYMRRWGNGVMPRWVIE